MPESGVPPGTLVMLVLRVLQGGPLHGYAIAQRIHALSSDVLQVEEGSLYPALQRILVKGWAKAEWGVSETNRRVRFYRLTQDLRFGARLLWRAPAFTLTAVAVLALGVGVNLAAFQMFDRLALSPRPVRDAHTLVNLYRRSPNSTS